MKTANKQIRSLRQGKKDGKGMGMTDEDNDEITFDNVLSDLIGTTLANKMGKNDPEYKNFKENFDNVTKYFSDRFTFIADELILDIFTEINDRAGDFVAVISKNMIDFCEMSEFFIHALKNTNPLVTSNGSGDGEDVEERSIFRAIIDTYTKIGNLVLNEDPHQTEVYFLEYCL